MVRAAAIALAASLALASSAVAADRKFQPYEGRDAVKEGVGGTKIVTDGVDIWTTGDPPRRYRILGVIIDKRQGLLSGSALNSKAFAKRIRDAGGDAAIFMDQERSKIGGLVTANAFTYAEKKVSRFVVIKYEE